jgi:ABC-type Mn2+/Zn2+ transport system permease subunit
VTLLHELHSPLIRRALVEAVLVGTLCGATGVHVVLRRLPFFTLALSHATFPGVVLASLLGLGLFLGGTVSAFGLVVVVALIGADRRLEASTATGVALAGTFALGVLLQSARAGPSRDLAAFLVGDVLTVRTSDVVTTVAVSAVVLGILAATHKELVFSAFDPGGAAAAGYPTSRISLFAMGLIALTVVTSVPAVGTVLVVTLLVTPALAARQWTDRVGLMMTVAAAIGAAAGVAGLAASSQWGVAAGAAIALAATGLLAASVAARLVRTWVVRRWTGPSPDPRRSPVVAATRRGRRVS